MTLEIELSEEDYFHFVHFTSWRAPFARKNRVKYFMRFYLYLTIILFGFFYFTEKPFQWTPFFISVIPVVLLSGFVLPIFVERHHRKLARQAFRNPENKSFFRKTFVFFNDEGIEARDDLSVSFDKWSSLIRCSETAHYFYLYKNAIQALVVPKRIFASAAKEDEFRRILPGIIHVSKVRAHQ